MIEGECPSCKEELIMRLPHGMNYGTFSIDCPGCDKDLEIEAIRGDAGSIEIRINGKLIKPKKAKPPSRRGQEKPPVRVIPEEIDLEMDLPYHKRLRVVFVLLMIVGVLGVFSSFTTIAGSFSINDLEEKSPNNLVTLSVWVIDADSGRSINGVEVILIDGSNNFSATSDMEGLAVIEDLISGEMELVLHKDGYRTVRSDITIKKGSPNVVDIPMERGDEDIEMPILVHQFEPKTYSPVITNVAATLMLLASVLAFIAAAFVYRKEFFLLVLASSFLSIFSFGFLLGSVLATIALVLIILSYDGFSHTHILKKMLESVSTRDIRGRMRSDQRDLSGLPPLRRR